MKRRQPASDSAPAIPSEAPTDPPEPITADLEGLGRRVSLPVHVPVLDWQYKKGDHVIKQGRLLGVAAVAAVRQLDN